VAINLYAPYMINMGWPRVGNILYPLTGRLGLSSDITNIVLFFTIAQAGMAWGFIALFTGQLLAPRAGYDEGAIPAANIHLDPQGYSADVSPIDVLVNASKYHEGEVSTMDKPNRQTRRSTQSESRPKAPYALGAAFTPQGYGAGAFPIVVSEDAPEHREGAGVPLAAPALQPPRCQACGAILSTPGHACQACGAAQHGIAQTVAPAQQAAAASPSPLMVQYVAAPKSAALAVFLTFLWLGAGHLYAGRIATGILLLLVEGVLVLLALTGVGLIIALPVWFILFICAAPLAAQAVGKANRGALAPQYAAPVR